jgi:hypothetical protein
MIARSFNCCLFRVIGAALVVFACGIIAGCQTAAQRQADAILQNNRDGKQRVEACFQKASDDLVTKFARGTYGLPPGTQGLPSLQLANVPTEAEVAVITAHYNETAKCRELEIKETMNILPGLVPFKVQAYQDIDLVWFALMQRKISWNEAMKKMGVIEDGYKSKALSVAAQVDHELAVSHQSELAQRRVQLAHWEAALIALSQWTDRQTVLLQNHRLINRLNRPVITRCYAIGRTINCISR